MAEKYLYFDNRKFTRDDSTGYYLCSSKSPDGKRRRMHTYVWEFYNGLIPKGYQVHHLDEDRSNNSIENLELLTRYDHLSFHGKERAMKEYGGMIKNLDENARPKAKEWHSSKVGREWHRIHYGAMKEKLYVNKQFICACCGKEFIGIDNGATKYCSSNCKSAWRRKSGVDDVKKICKDCGGDYIANKYQKTKYCPICKNKKHTTHRSSRCLQYGS